MSFKHRPNRFILRRFSLGALALVLGGTFSWSGVSAQTYPQKPIHLIVPFAPGGITDISARMVGIKLTERLGQPVVIENRAGGNQTIGTQYVANAVPDGYTLIMGTMGSHAVNASLRNDLKYDLRKDFAPISLVFVQPLVLIINPKLEIKTLDQLLQRLKASPGKFTYGSAGVGTTAHMAAELFQNKLGVQMVHAAYKGSGPMLNDLIAGVIDFAFDYAPTALPQVRSGRLQALAVTSTSRADFAPTLPSISEVIPGFQATAWQGLFAPAKTPPAVLELLSREIAQILKTPDVMARVKEMGTEGVGSDPAEFNRFVQREIDLWAKVVRENNIQP